MPTRDLEPRLLQLEHHAVVQVLRAHPHWTLGEVADHLGKAGDRARAFRAVKLRDLIQSSNSGSNEHLPGLTRPIDLVRDSAQLVAAMQATGPDFDGFVLAALRGARGQRVSASYLRDRVGGPRWKLLGALSRLIAAGQVERTGRTYGTRYSVIEHP